MSLTTFLTSGWNIFKQFKVKKLADQEKRTFGKKWDIFSLYEAKVVPHSNEFYVLLRKKKKNPLDKDEIKEHIKSDIERFKEIERKAMEIRDTTVSLRKKDEGELKKNPKPSRRSMGSIWNQFQYLARAGVFNNAKNEWLKFASYYNYGGSDRDYAEQWWDRWEKEYKSNPINLDIQPLEPIDPRITEKKYVLIVSLRKEQPKEYLGLKGIVQETKQFSWAKRGKWIEYHPEEVKGEGFSAKISKEKRERFKKKYVVLLENGEIALFYDWQVKNIPLEEIKELSDKMEKLERTLEIEAKASKKQSKEREKEWIMLKKMELEKKEFKRPTIEELYIELINDSMLERPHDYKLKEYRSWYGKINKILIRLNKIVKYDRFLYVLENTKLKQQYSEDLKVLLKQKPEDKEKEDYKKWGAKVIRISKELTKLTGESFAFNVLKDAGYKVTITK